MAVDNYIFKKTVHIKTNLVLSVVDKNVYSHKLHGKRKEKRV